ncbi:caspase family protein [Flammeovirgaceae bacterium SG7u.111]|nr:caspase family protein [Flammeovirgaceae bacterium SG7u.132]WPO37303.1 caspase family protein [Flammeovirgaceae bacterium SG7u.111]
MIRSFVLIAITIFSFSLSQAQSVEITRWMGLQGYPYGVEHVAISSDGRYFAVLPKQQSNTVDLYDENYQKVWSHRGVLRGKSNVAAFSPDGKYLFFSNYGKGTDIGVLNVQTRKIVRKLRKHMGLVTSLSFSANGKYMVSAGEDGFIRVWEYTNESFFEIQSFKSNSGAIRNVAFADNGQLFAAANSNQTVTIFSLEGKQFKASSALKLNGVQAKEIVFGKNASQLAMVQSDGSVQVFNRSGYDYQFAFKLPTGYGTTSLAFSPNGDYLLVAGSDRSVKMYGITKERALLSETLWDHEKAVADIAISGNGKMMLTAGAEGVANIWKVEGMKGRGEILGISGGTSSRPSGLPPVLSIEEISFSESVLDAEESAELKVTVKNSGPGEAQNVRLLLRGSLGEVLIPKETTFPSIAAKGGLETLTVRISGSANLPTSSAFIDIAVEQADFGIRLQGRRLTFNTRHSPKPRLTLAKFAVLEHVSASPNNQVDLNEMIDVKFVVQNVGEGTARDVELNLTNNQKGVLYLGVEEQGQLTRQNPRISEIPSGKYVTVVYRYFVNSEFAGTDLLFDLNGKERLGSFGFNERKSVAINKTLREEGQIVVMDGNTPDYRPGQVEDVPDLYVDVRQNIPQTRKVNNDAVAVVIGNQHYRNRDVPSVDFAIEDVQTMKEYLVKTFGFKEGNILYYKDATQADFNALFGTPTNPRGRLYNYVKAGISDVFVYYSGHGAPDPESKEAFFVPVDCDPSVVALNGYGVNTFYNNISQIPYRSLTVVVDACFSGSSAKGMLLKNISPVFIQPKMKVINDEKAIVFTSAGGEQVSSWYPEKRHSLFTYYFLKGLQGEANTNKDRQLTLAELESYIQSQVPYMARRLNNREQSPEVFGEQEKVLVDY